MSLNVPLRGPQNVRDGIPLVVGTRLGQFLGQAIALFLQGLETRKMVILKLDPPVQSALLLEILGKGHGGV